MIRIGKRQLMTTSAMAATVALGACAWLKGQAPITASQLATDTGLIADGLSAVLADIQAIPGIASDTVAKVAGWIKTIEADAKQVAGQTATASGPAVDQIVALVQSVAGVVSPLIPQPIGSIIMVAINAAMSLLPMILAAVGKSARGIAAAVMDPAAARLALRGLVAQKLGR